MEEKYISGRVEPIKEGVVKIVFESPYSIEYKGRHSYRNFPARARDIDQYKQSDGSVRLPDSFVRSSIERLIDAKIKKAAALEKNVAEWLKSDDNNDDDDSAPRPKII